MPAPEQLQPIWERIRKELRREVPDFQFHLWLDPLELAGVGGQTLFVRAPDHIRTWVRDRYLPLIREAARRGFKAGAVVEIVDAEWREESGGGYRRPACAGGALNPKYTFEEFVIGKENRFAHGAALAVAELPGQAYNPLFIHGPPGLGKTHLLHAIGNFVLRHGAGLTVRYATVEEFTSEFVGAIQTSAMRSFKERFRSVDVLLLDDVQFLAEKLATEEELFHTFNDLRESGRQLVMTSDRSPKELHGLEQRLSERFGSGLVVGLEVPDVLVRQAILESRARLDSIDAPPDLLAEIAGHVTTSVRALEAALIQVVAYASLRGEPPTAELARHLLGRLGVGGRQKACGVAEILAATSGAFGVTPEALVARDRRPQVALARKVAMHLTRDLTAQSLPQIGRAFGGRDHSTVLSALRSIERELAFDAELASTVENLRQSLSNKP
ncbi:MAG: chromosomal replication initiator protein DnaA [Thermoleophilaceae bacterium]